MDKAKRARTAETPKQPSLGLKLRAPYFYPDRAYSAEWVTRAAASAGTNAWDADLAGRHPAAGLAKHSTLPSEALVRRSAVAADPLVSAGHVKKPDLLRMRPVERINRLGGGLQYYLAALLREISLSLRR